MVAMVAQSLFPGWQTPSVSCLLFKGAIYGVSMLAGGIIVAI